ncbi:uncharacterized protein FOMMEDRAFT_24405 [Fomitiporia mediterranea MF3/22]|uniref:Uncharacterized protein n=1 Tax=Fomitiporia mediterranea (strain MF3/22) TaxID=694068 RepID=R7SFJ4_FOMME|nr:uncharacterized protein FOMMEDRAFT_17127 [Fomitiporia mediterranea MF3/22]XP_007272259.1 uncharacterized protein FOMMEDRAFT_24405 [Fomitiporia mediterranea MF3/22]EJC97478.1 hypothetical protein FOMMEDRAFT_24405 [Fomitiporia mediterranea MF3/22]EJD06638.1 hypothetical protein FOMMEDRAFT_17127 [Fomitiporia mediterranea MF3/22]
MDLKKKKKSEERTVTKSTADLLRKQPRPRPAYCTLNSAINLESEKENDFVVQTGPHSALANIHHQHQSISQEQSNKVSASGGTVTVEGVQDHSKEGRA